MPDSEVGYEIYTDSEDEMGDGEEGIESGIELE